LPVDNYKVSVYATFNENAISVSDTKAAANTAGTQTKKEIKAVAFNPTGTWYAAGAIAAKSAGTIEYDGAATMAYGHYVAKAYPILSVKDKNTTSENARLDIAIVKNNDDANTINMAKIDTYAADDGTTSHWHVIE
jgi:hypothetical protein